MSPRPHPPAATSGRTPSVTAVLLSYNCEAFIGEAVRSALEQDCEEPLEIVISDDASTDRTYAAIEAEIGRDHGPHRVLLNRRVTNSGSKAAHLNDVFPLCSGEIVVSFDGDDVSEPFRVRALVERFERHPDAFAVYSQFSLIDRVGRPYGNGNVPHPPAGADVAEWFARIDAYAAGGTLAVRRAVTERFGPLPDDVNEDVVLPFRASLLGGVEFVPEPLVRVRRHADSLTADWQRFASIEQYRARMRRGIERGRHALRSRFADLAAAAMLVPARLEDVPRLEAAVRSSMRHAEMTEPLLHPSFAVRLRALARLTTTGAYRSEWVAHASLALAPDWYLRYKRHRVSRSAAG
jgi:glycosyltransferase involved in cell wall biosynthesis